MSERVGVGRALKAMLVASILIPLALFAGLSWYLREDQLREGRADVQQTLLLLDEHAQRVFEAQDLIIRRVDDRIRGMSWEEIRQSRDVYDFLARLARNSEHVDGLWLIPPDGATANSADFFPFPPVDTSDREYFRALEDRDHLHFGEMIQGRLKGNFNFNLSRRRSPTEEFDGLILVTASLDYFTNFWSAASDYEPHVAGLFRPDGEILARYPQLDEIPDKLSEESPLRAAMRERDEGTYTSTSTIDGSERVYAYSQVGDYPIFVGFGVDEDALLEPWREGLVLQGLAALVSSLLLLGIVTVAFGQSRRLGRAMVSWRDTARRLQVEVDRRERAEDLVEEKDRLVVRLRDATAERKAILDTIVEGLVAYDAEGGIIYCNGASQSILRLAGDLQPDFAHLAQGGRLLTVDGEPVADAATPVARILSGQRVEHEELRLAFPETGEEAVVRFQGAPFRDGAGHVAGAVLTFADVTEEKASEERRALLMAELDHRVRNMLATIMAMVRISSRHAETREDLVETLIGRVGAMGRTHGLLTESGWKGASLRQIVEDEVSPYVSGGRLSVSGGVDMALAPRDAVNFALVIHELATNAAKHGAWSNESGQVEIAWTREFADSAYLHFLWRERGGPPVGSPESRGFGTTIVNSAFAADRDCEVDLRFEPEGVVCEVRLPLARARAKAPGHGAEAPRKRRSEGRLYGVRVLVAEDEPILRLELATLLQDTGARVVGPAANLDEGLALAERYDIDVALLDINLGGRNVSNLAERLSAQGVPVVFLSGYRDPELLSPLLRGLPRLQKPAAAEDIVETLAEAADRPDRPTGRHVLGR